MGVEELRACEQGLHRRRCVTKHLAPTPLAYAAGFLLAETVPRKNRPFRPFVSTKTTQYRTNKKKNKNKCVFLFLVFFWLCSSFDLRIYVSAVFNLRRSLLVSNWTASKDTGIRARARQWQIENCGKYTHLRLWSPCSHAHSSSTPICINFSLSKGGECQKSQRRSSGNSAQFVVYKVL
jgi:hypothetical protein